MLQAPSFVYVSELGEPDDATGFRLLTGTELASRISFFILGRTPDTALLDLAESGGLQTEDDIRAQAEAMVDSAQARVAMISFFDELFRLRFVEGTIKDAELYPMFTPELGEAMRQESLLLLNDVVWQQDGDYRDVFTADYTFVNDTLAEVYGMSPPGMGETFVKVDWPAEQNRAGVLSQASFLTVHSHQDFNSPTKRGKYVSLAVLCTPIPPPPPDVMAELPEPMEGQTLREALIQHKNDPACASCHDLTDEIGFAFEFFGPIGEYRTLDNGQPIEASGDLPSLGTWDHAAGLAQALKADPRTDRCLVHNLIRGELGRLETSGENDEIDLLLEEYAAQGHSLKSLLVELAASPIFRYVDEPR
jgi:hypothetical protein